MELPEVRNADSPRDLLRDLGEVYTDNVKLGRDVVYSHILREGVLKNEDTVHWREDFAHYCYNLRYRGFYDDTNSVEDSVEQLEEEVGEGECDRLMKFLTLLSGSVSHKTPRSGLIPTGKQVEVLPHHVLPAAQYRYHGDSHAPGVHSSGYLMYRDELFTSVSSCPDIDQSEKILAGFPESSTVSRFIRPPNNKLPPPKITLTGLPAPEPTYQILPLPAPPSRSQSVEEYSSNPVLADLPALPPPTVTGIFKSLSRKSDDLPVYLGPVLRTSVKERYQPALRNITQRFAPVRPSNSAVSDSSGVESDDDHEAWEEAYKDMDKEFPTPTYELMGRKVVQERPYLTESGAQVYTRLCVLLCSPYSDLDVVTEQHVLYQCQYVLIGIPTSIFQFDKTKVEFVPLQNICYTGVSPDSLVDCLYSIAYSGTLYLRLKMFCDQYSTVERYGNVVKGLVSAVEQYLNLYQAFLSQIPISSLIQLIWKTKDLTSQLEFLCNLLLLEEGLPTGTALIEYLYHTAEILTASPYYKIMLALIRAAFAPYVKFLELWLCEGRVWDDWDEFNVSSHHEWMNNKDYLFWQYAYTEREEVKLPGFLEELREQLVNTGKLINLFRLCVPDHPLSVSKIRPPKLQLTFNDHNITLNMNKWDSYRDAVERELNTQAVVRDMKKREEEDRRIAKLAAAKDDARRRIGMIMAEAGALRASAVSNKKQEVQRLQEQMLDRAEQRAAMLEAEKKEDKERIERNQTEQYELVGKVRAQLEEYYGSLTKEKAREERRSLWRIQRMKLNRLRRAHLMLEVSHLNTELRQKLEENRPNGIQVIQSEVQGQGTQPGLGTVSNPETTPALSQTPESTDFISETVPTDAGSKTRKTWDQPINININISVDGNDEAVKLQDISISSSVNDNGTDIGNFDVSDNDSEISFTVSPGNPCKSDETEVSNSKEPLSRLDSEGSDMKNVLYSGKGESIPEHHVTSKHEPDGQMKDVLYGKSETDKTDHQKSKETLSRLDSEGTEMKNILYSGPESGNTDDSNLKDPLSRLDSEGSEMKDILYSNNSQSNDHIVASNEPAGQMKELLYGEESTSDDKNDDSELKKPLSRLDSEGSEMKDVLYGKSETDGTDHQKSKQPLSRLDSEGSEMKNILYSGPESGNTDDSKDPLSRLDSEGSEMKDILYSSNSQSNDHIVTSNEPAGQMKEMLYGEESTSGYGSTKPGDNETETETETEISEESVTPTPSVIGVKSKGGRMREILYGQPQTKLNEESEIDQKVSQISISDDSGIDMDYQVQPIQLAYPELETGPNPNIMTDRLTKYYVAEETFDEDEVETYRTLEITLRRLLLQPLLLQTDLVNAAAVRYFVDELKINYHFDALRSYLCMSDGMFGDSLSKGIFKMIDSGMDLMSSPAKLNAVLHEAMECSKINNHLLLEGVRNQVSGDVLNCLVLRYDVEWPSNIIITDNSLYKYNEIFKFLLKLKHGCFMLDKIWFLLGSVDQKGTSPQIRRLQVCRYEVSQCLHAVQIYMTHQLHNISWHELQTELKGASSVSQLQDAHENYLNNALERLLLGESTRAPHDIILKIFKHVTLFVRLLESAQFSTDVQGLMTHPHFDKIIQRHDDFTKQAVFILKVAESSNNSGYKPYIDEFMLRLDFNHYYQSSNTIVKRRSMAGLNLLGSGSKAKLTNSLSSPNTNLASRSVG